jgi:hypothetical protein
MWLQLAGAGIRLAELLLSYNTAAGERMALLVCLTSA